MQAKDPWSSSSKTLFGKFIKICEILSAHFPCEFRVLCQIYLINYAVRLATSAVENSKGTETEEPNEEAKENEKFDAKTVGKKSE